MLWLDRFEQDDAFRPANDRVVMEVAPIGQLQQRCQQRGHNYASLDLRPGAARICGDLCLAPFPDRSVDLLVCFHVLEHVPEDLTAMAEIARLLSDDGIAIISVPWNPGAEQTLDDPDADPADFERLYGQRDHVRMYGRDFTLRLQSCGLAVEEQVWADLFTPEEMTVHALAGSDDRFWICRRDPK